MKKNSIRFVDDKYELDFMIEDCGKVVYVDSTGKESIKMCRYIDDYHFSIDNTVFHIMQFTEMLKNTGSKVYPYNN